MAREASPPNQVRLGDDDYRLVPQRIGRISRKLEAIFDVVGGGSPADVDTDIGPNLYEALQVFIPDLMPYWKMLGYPNGEAYDALRAHESAVETAQDTYAAELLEGDEAPAGRPWHYLTDEQQGRFELPAELQDFEDPYDEAADASPTPPEIIDAVEAIFKIHGGERLTRLVGKFLTPRMIQSQLERWRVETSLRRSQRLQLQSGASDPTTSTPTSPTTAAPESAASPSLEPSTS